MCEGNVQRYILYIFNLAEKNNTHYIDNGMSITAGKQQYNT